MAAQHRENASGGSGQGAATALRALSGRLQDSVRGYRRSAEDIADGYLRGEFDAMAAERARMAKELGECLSSLGQTVKPRGTAAGGVHRLWLNVKSLAQGGDRRAVLREVTRGDAALEDQYDAALACDLPSDARELMERQLRSVRRIRNRYRAMAERIPPSGRTVTRRLGEALRPVRQQPMVAILATLFCAGVIGGLLLQQRRHEQRRSGWRWLRG